MQRCLAVNAWIACAVGAVVPLLVLGRWEAAGRRRLFARRWQQAQQPGSGREQAAADLEGLAARECAWPQPWPWVDACVSLYWLWLALALLLHARLL